MRWSALFLVVVTTAACGGIEPQLAARRASWENKLREAVPPGSTMQHISAWGAAQNIHFEYLPQQHWMYANVERVPVTGIPFPCSEWLIIIKITIDDSGQSVSNDVSTVGKCV